MASLSNINGLFDVHSTGAILFSNTHGTSGQILRSNGNAAPTWVDSSTVIGGPYLPLTGGTLTGPLSGTSATFSGTLTVGGNNVVGFSGSWNGANMPGSRWNGYSVNGGEVVFQRDNPSSGRMSMLVDGQYYAGENGGFYSLYSGNDYNNRKGFYADSSGVLQFNASCAISGTVTASRIGIPSANTSFDFYNNGTSYFNNVVTIDAEFIQSSGATSSFSGDINQYGSIFRTSSFINLLNNRNTKKYLNTPYFTNGDSNQAVNIQFPNVSQQGYYKITLSGSYSHQDISGILTKVIPFGYNANGSIWRTGNGQSEITVATGGVSTNFTIGNLAWDSTNSKFIIPIYKLTSTGNSVKILVEYLGGAANNLSDVTLSAKYTQPAPSPFNVRQYQSIRDRLGVGTISPSVKFQVQHDQTAESNVIFMNNSTGSNAAMRLSLNVGSPAGHDPMISFNIGDGGLDWTMGVDNSDGDKFKISGGTDSHNPNLGANDRFVITSTGFTKLKNDGDATWDGYNFHAISNSVVSQPTVMVYNSASSGNQYGVNVVHTSTNANTTGRFFLGATNNGASERIKIYTNGNIQNTNNSYGQLSDLNLKENIVNATPKLDEINQLRIVNFNYIGDDLKQIGVVAQELEQTFPGLVDEVEHTQDGETSMVKSVKYSVFVPMLIKAIQELEARVKELENK
jgi:hypothetical protein